MKKILMVFASVSIAACGGGGGGSGGSSASGLDLVLNHFNSTEGLNRVNYMERSESTGEITVDVSCDTFQKIAKSDLAPDVSSTYANGVCFDDDSECDHVTDNALLTTQGTLRIVDVIEGDGNAETIVFNGFSQGFGVIYAGAYEKVAHCDDSVKPAIPRFNGVYVGNVYSIDQRNEVLADQSLIKSANITLDCVNGFCKPRDEKVLRGFGAQGIDLTPTSTEGGDYIRTAIATQSYVRGYDIHAMSDNSGKTISMIGYPIDKGTTFFDCYDGECVTMSFKKVQ